MKKWAAVKWQKCDSLDESKWPEEWNRNNCSKLASCCQLIVSSSSSSSGSVCLFVCPLLHPTTVNGQINRSRRCRRCKQCHASRRQLIREGESVSVDGCMLVCEQMTPSGAVGWVVHRRGTCCRQFVWTWHCCRHCWTSSMPSVSVWLVSVDCLS